MLIRIGDFIERYCWSILTVWLLVVMGCSFYLFISHQPFEIGGISDPNSESARAEKFMSEKFPYGGSRIFILYKSDQLIATDPQFKSEVEQSLAGLDRLALPHSVITPYMNDQQISKDKHSAFAMIFFKQTAEQAANHMTEIRGALGKTTTIKMMVGGEPTYIADVKLLSQHDLFRSELIAFPLSMITLLCVFGGIAAAAIPIITGTISVIIIVSLLFMFGSITELSVFVLNIGTMLGLGLSLDYSLLIINRFREEMAKGRTEKQAIIITLSSAGKAVFFSGLAVFISMSALLVFPVNVLYSIGVGGVVVVTVSVLSALILLPTVLMLVGKKINLFTIPFFKRREYAPNPRKSRWFRLAMHIMRHPLLFFIPTILILLFMGYPFLSVKVNRPDSTILPTWVESRQLVDEFHRIYNFNEMLPTNILFKADYGTILLPENVGALYDFAEQLKKDPRVDAIVSIVTVKPGASKKDYEYFYALPTSTNTPQQHQFILQTTRGQYTIMAVTSKYHDNDARSMDLIRTIREMPIGNKITFQVSGTSALIMDTIKTIYTLFFKMIVVISIITYLVLMVLLRSVVLPLKAIIMNLLSLLASYGMLVFVFQEGHLASLFHFTSEGFTDLNLPVILFFGLFGLSMDYEVFLLTRIKEFYDQTHDNQLSVALGIERSARIITSAALIVVLVSFSFVSADIIFVKAFGLGTAVAIAVDATFIRILLVPATMRLLGEWNWYLPKWLDKILPKIRFDK